MRNFGQVYMLEFHNASPGWDYCLVPPCNRLLRITQTGLDLAEPGAYASLLECGKSGLTVYWQVCWRRKRDSNPRASHPANGFQDRRFQPLTHSSAAILIIATDARPSGPPTGGRALPGHPAGQPPA